MTGDTMEHNQLACDGLFPNAEIHLCCGYLVLGFGSAPWLAMVRLVQGPC